MAYKDEYEVARLYSDPAYMRSVVDAFGRNAKLTFLLAPPLISRRRSNGELIERRFGPWMMHVFRVLRAGKWMRGKSLDARSAGRLSGEWSDGFVMII
jgi:indolepyruvate ferredoxin oxidoreductase